MAQVTWLPPWKSRRWPLISETSFTIAQVEWLLWRTGPQWRLLADSSHAITLSLTAALADQLTIRQLGRQEIGQSGPSSGCYAMPGLHRISDTLVSSSIEAGRQRGEVLCRFAQHSGHASFRQRAITPEASSRLRTQGLHHLAHFCQQPFA